jgi:hypothetical protein
MSRSTRFTILLAIVGSTVSACAAPTAPSFPPRITTPRVTGPSTDEIIPDPNCRNGYNVTNGRAC